MNNSRLSDVFYLGSNPRAAGVLNVIDTGTTVFEENTNITPVKVFDEKKYRGYVPWGDDNQRPYEIMKLIRKDEVMSQNQLFNVQVGYSGGLKFCRRDDTPIESGPVYDFFKYNRPARYLIQQVSDMKHYMFTISVIILSKDGKSIVQLRHKEACYCRFETCNPKNGRIENVFFANWEKSGVRAEDIEVIPLLDVDNPIGDLEERMATGTNSRKFAILNTFPSVGNTYYAFPPYCAIFNSGWYDIKQMIPGGKKAKFSNGLAVKYKVEVHPKYKEEIMRAENITDPEKVAARWKKEQQNIRDFLHGIENSGKTWITGFYVDTKGNEQSYVKIEKVNNEKEGGDWIEDTEEASNMMCYAQGIHPSIIGATPGKTKGSFSGSDKRELFTMKQSMEKPYHDILLEPYYIIREYNKKAEKDWENVKVYIPLLMLTTLDKGKDAVETVPADTDPDTKPVKE